MIRLAFRFHASHHLFQGRHSFSFAGFRQRTKYFFCSFFVVVLQIIFAQPKCTAHTFNRKPKHIGRTHTFGKKAYAARTTNRNEWKKRKRPKTWLTLKGNQQIFMQKYAQQQNNTQCSTMTFMIFSHVLRTFRLEKLPKPFVSIIMVNDKFSLFHTNISNNFFLSFVLGHEFQELSNGFITSYNVCNTFQNA